MKKRSKAARKIKGIFIFLIIIAAVGAVFYFGFFQFQLPADTYAVIYTKLNGWDPEAVVPGSYRIEWEGLLPTNLSIEKILIEERGIELEVSGDLPSAEPYSAYLEGRPDFSYSYRFSLSYSLKPGALPELVTEDFLRADNLDGWYSDLEKTILADGISFINGKSADDAYMQKIAYNYRMMADDLTAQIEGKYPDIKIHSFVPSYVKIPDFDLYREGKKLYFERIRFNEKIKTAAMEKTSERLVEESAKLELLEKYGAIFSKYPELINYYDIYREDGEGLIQPIELPDITD